MEASTIVERRPAVGRVLVAGLIGALAAAAAGLVWFLVSWMLNIHGSFLAILIGPAVGLAIYRAAGRRGSPPLQALSLLVALVAILIAEVFVMRMIAVRALEQEGYQVALFLPLRAQWNLIAAGLVGDAVAASEGAKILPFATPLFFAMSLYYAIRLPRHRPEDELTHSS